MNNQWFSKVAVWLVIALVLFTVFKQFDTRGGASAGYLGYSDFLEEVRAKRIKSAVIQEGQGGTEIVAVTHDDRKIRTTATYLDRGLVGDLIANGVKFDVKPREEGSLLMTLLVSWGPMLLLIGVWVYFMRQMQGGGKGGAFSFGKSKARMLDENTNQITFADVAGCDEAKEEVKEVVDFLKDPQRFQKLGGRIPRGLLLVGPPGTGKTLLAKGIAGEAKVPFFSISGSDFVEMFVGVGAARVRDMFDNAKKNAPCIIFIDEIDAVGRQRGAGLGGGHDEREQTLNQLVVEMDGFNTNDGVILMAATNRPDVLDRALLRPGRFDRQIVVPNPDIRGRTQILEIHVRNQKVPTTEDVNLEILARGTPGFSGADLANMVNEAALLAARRIQDKVTMVDFEDAKDRVLMGPARKSMLLTPEEKLTTSYHEIGHALLAILLPESDPLHKVTIVPRGPALGVTSILPSEDRHTMSKKQCLAWICMSMGGRAAEDIVFGEFNNGVSSDLKNSTRLAHSMVCEWGMSELGPISFGSNEEVFLGRDFARSREFSEVTASSVDREIHQILEEGYKQAKAILTEHKDLLIALSEALFERETLSRDEVFDIIKKHGKEHIIPEPRKKIDTPKPKPPSAPAVPQAIAEPERDNPIPGMPPGDFTPGLA